MYQPTLHREDRLDVQHALVESHPLGLLISNGPDDLLANAIPFILKRDAGPQGTLLAHLARANTQWQTLDGQKVLIVFQGPQAYVSPSHYETKKETARSFPLGTTPSCRHAGPRASIQTQPGSTPRLKH